ncbi:hypothetical protein Acr_23g0014890 [Actinidia rufa]|uniref:Uncharacterized protein n=1 Tax=Actinidia rufa TaxID=165716 RepID=A0A7J0GR49_9ERIC|nr:hypothetical protein Acr_23g0014890 [Actinidia rufa]
MNYLRGPNGNWRSSNSAFGKLARSIGKFLRCIPLRHFRFFLFFSQVQRDGWDLSTDDESARGMMEQVSIYRKWRERIKGVEMESGIRVFLGEFQDESNFGDYKLPFDIDANDLLFLNRKYSCTGNVDKFSVTNNKGGCPSKEQFDNMILKVDVHI